MTCHARPTPQDTAVAETNPHPVLLPQPRTEQARRPGHPEKQGRTPPPCAAGPGLAYTGVQPRSGGGRRHTIERPSFACLGQPNTRGRHPRPSMHPRPQLAQHDDTSTRRPPALHRTLIAEARSTRGIPGDDILFADTRSYSPTHPITRCTPRCGLMNPARDRIILSPQAATLPCTPILRPHPRHVHSPGMGIPSLQAGAP